MPVTTKKMLEKQIEEFALYSKELQDQIKALEADREQFRRHFIFNFKYWLRLLANKNVPDVAVLVKSEALWIQRFEPWNWGECDLLTKEKT